LTKPQNRTYKTPLPSYEPILLRIDKAPEVVQDQRDSDKENVIIWFTVLTAPWGQQDPPIRERQNHSNTVNPKGDGTPSLLSQLINATRPADLTMTELKDTEVETISGVVEAIGKVKTTERGDFWNVIEYRRPKTAVPGQVAEAAPPAPEPAPAADDYQYQDVNGVRMRWKAPMTAWEPAPPPVAPPPPPAPPAPVPPPVPQAAPPPPPAAPGQPAKPNIRF
jgi:hypothetical protein